MYDLPDHPDVEWIIATGYPKRYQDYVERCERCDKDMSDEEIYEDNIYDCLCVDCLLKLHLAR